MKPYELNGHKYYGVESKVFRKYLSWIDTPVGIAELLNNLRAAIVMDIDYADIHKGWLYPHLGPPPHELDEIPDRTRSVRAGKATHER